MQDSSPSDDDDSVVVVSVLPPPKAPQAAQAQAAETTPSINSFNSKSIRTNTTNTNSTGCRGGDARRYPPPVSGKQATRDDADDVADGSTRRKSRTATAAAAAAATAATVGGCGGGSPVGKSNTEDDDGGSSSTDEDDDDDDVVVVVVSGSDSNDNNDNDRREQKKRKVGVVSSDGSGGGKCRHHQNRKLRQTETEEEEGEEPPPRPPPSSPPEEEEKVEDGDDDDGGGGDNTRAATTTGEQKKEKSTLQRRTNPKRAARDRPRQKSEESEAAVAVATTGDDDRKRAAKATAAAVSPKAAQALYDAAKKTLCHSIGITEKEVVAALDKMGRPPYGLNKAMQLIHQAKAQTDFDAGGEKSETFKPKVGMRIRKYFAGVAYVGEVTKEAEWVRDPETGDERRMWEVTYDDDGEKDDMDFDELFHCWASRPVRPNPVRGRQMCFLELFSGCGSVSQEFAQRLWRVRSIDNDPKSNATDKVDVMKLQYCDIGMVPDSIWASPPCFTYSHLAGGKHRSPKLGEFEKTPEAHLSNEFLARVLHIARWARHYNPHLIIVIENPHALLQKMPLMDEVVNQLGLHAAVVDYCAFGRYDKKPTQLWTNVSLQKWMCVGLCLCLCKSFFCSCLITLPFFCSCL